MPNCIRFDLIGGPLIESSHRQSDAVLKKSYEHLAVAAFNRYPEKFLVKEDCFDGFEPKPLDAYPWQLGKASGKIFLLLEGLNRQNLVPPGYEDQEKRWLYLQKV